MKTLAWISLGTLLGSCTLLLDPEELRFPPEATTDGSGLEGALDPGPLGWEAQASTEVASDAAPADGAAPITVKSPGQGDPCSVRYFDSSGDAACPKTCPSDSGWLLVYEAIGPEGATYRWDFTASKHKIEPPSVDHRTATVLAVLDTAVFGGQCLPTGTVTVEAFEVTATLTVDGKVAATVNTPINPTAVSDSAACQVADTCPAP